MGEDLYACAVCEESFPIAKSLVNHVNDCHVSLQSSVEPKKVVKSMQTSIEHQKENDTKIDTIKLEKEETKRLKNYRKEGVTNIASSIELEKENNSKVVKTLPSSINHQKRNDTKVVKIKLKKDETKERKNKQLKRFIDIYSKIVTSFNEHQKKNDSKEFISLPSSIECQNENDTKVDTIKLEKDVKERKNYHQFYKNSGRFMCKFCNQSATSKGHLIAHERIHTGEKPFSCSHCSKSFRLKTGMQLHEKTHSGEKPFSCNYCEKSFLWKDSLKNHELTHEKERAFPCQYCTKTFTLKSYMVAHEKVHTGEGYACEYCDKIFSLENNLKTHKRLHLGDKPFSCKYCDQKFTQKSMAQGHERTHTGEKPFVCDYCNKRFNRKDTLNNHKLRHTREEKPRCSYCGKGFLNAVYVRKHENNVCKKIYPRLPLVIREQPGNIMPKSDEDMKLNPNRDAHSPFSESDHLNIQTKIDGEIRKMKRGKDSTGEIVNMPENGYQTGGKVEEQVNSSKIKAVSKFGHQCKYCGKGFLNKYYVRKHEDNVCKMRSQTAQNIYELYEDPTTICEVSFNENDTKNIAKKPRIEGIVNEDFEETAETEFLKEFAKVKEQFLGFDPAKRDDKNLPRLMIV